MTGLGSLARPETSLAEPRRFKPVKVWAFLGAIFLGIEGWAVTMWIATGKATPTPGGPTPVPTWMKVAGHTWEVLGLLGFMVFLWRFLIRPWRREGRITLDGMFCIIFLTMYWQDLLMNYFQIVNTYNTMFFNLGSWFADIPGWSSPNANLLAEPLLFMGPVFVYGMFGGVVLSNFMMRKAKERNPRLGKLGLVVVAFCFILVFVMLVEGGLLLRLGINIDPGAIPELSLFAGKYYQYPLYELILASCLLTSWASLRFFRDDNGQTVAERGIDQLRVDSKWKQGIRFLALTGICNAIFLVTFSIPHQFFALKAGAWPEDVTKRSYFTDGICGPGTTYACPGPDTLIPRRGSLHVTPGGGVSR